MTIANDPQMTLRLIAFALMLSVVVRFATQRFRHTDVPALSAWSRWLTLIGLGPVVAVGLWAANPTGMTAGDRLAILPSMLFIGVAVGALFAMGLAVAKFFSSHPGDESHEHRQAH